MSDGLWATTLYKLLAEHVALHGDVEIIDIQLIRCGPDPRLVLETASGDVVFRERTWKAKFE